jgi:hypothetical protein
MVAQEGSARHHHHPVRAFPELPKGFALEQASAMFRALGDPARLRLLARLVDGEICVTELADLEQEKLTTVSARLKTADNPHQTEPPTLSHPCPCCGGPMSIIESLGRGSTPRHQPTAPMISIGIDTS